MLHVTVWQKTWQVTKAHSHSRGQIKMFIKSTRLPVVHEDIGLPDHSRRKTNTLNAGVVGCIPCQIVIIPVLQRKHRT